ncbi:calmodulin-binding protein 25-like [Juglans microcarpa x Juglans regia]|uniref:calmodulin-binding protein 25-like n=1 Tax=Juglans microcarpa x Juglans regia TaxID=2249226 RepID=UPI001B7E8F44|nr:calmodulin-binding protein 25-like [Juglans microcarpa x Juglans regia]
MASSENLASIEPWAFRPAFADSWISEAFSRDNDSLTKALQKSFCGANLDFLQTDTISPLLNLIKPDTAPTTPTVSSLSGGSEPETVVPQKRQRNSIPAAPAGKVSKRKSRASKRSQTTFITADPANFRQMVQQVTGARLGNSQMPVVPILKPEPQRPGSRLPGPGCLPTLDTSAFLLDHHQQQAMRPNSAAGAVTGVSGAGQLSFGPNMGLADGGGVAGLDFDMTFPSFPTLESWKVM